jgi:arylsulfatase A-like enzyme
MLLSRRRFFFGGLALPTLTRAAKPAGERPDVVLILVDGLPAWVLGCYGGRDIRTPNIDLLAQTGARFQRHCTAAPAAEPGRASLLAGGTGMQVGTAPSADPAGSRLAAMLGGLGYACHATAAGSGEAVVADAAGFLDRQPAGQPFFLIAGFSDLRPPYSGISEKYAAAYAGAKLESFFPSDPPAANATAGKEMLADPLGSLRQAAAAIAAVDAQVGALISKLAAKGLLDNTLALFTSPGGSLLTRHGLWGSGDSSDPVNMYEEAVTTPMIWRWPARIPPQTMRTELVSSVDLLPAIAELTAAPLTGNLSGRSCLPLVTGKALPKNQPWRNVVFSHLQRTDMVRDSRYKLVLRNFGQGPNEFYDLVEDPREQTNGYEDGRFNSIKPALADEIEKWKMKYSS